MNQGLHDGRMNQGLQDGRKIRQIREEHDLSIGELATRLGIKPQSLSNIEWNNKPAGAALAIEIARELGVTLGDIAPGLVTKLAADLQLPAEVIALTPHGGSEPKTNGTEAA